MRKRLLIGLSVVTLLLGVGAYLRAETTEWLGDMVFRQMSPALKFAGVLHIQNKAGTDLLTLDGDTGVLVPPLLTPALTTGSVFLPATDVCTSDIPTQLIPTRVAASNWSLARTATGAETYNIKCSLDSWLQLTGGTKGVKITSIDLVHQITVVNLTSNTWGKVSTRVFANNTATSIGSDLATTPTLNTATQTNPYVLNIVMATPAYLPSAAKTALDIEWTAVMANTGVYRVYGLNVNFTRLDH